MNWLRRFFPSTHYSWTAKDGEVQFDIESRGMAVILDITISPGPASSGTAPMTLTRVHGHGVLTPDQARELGQGLLDVAQQADEAWEHD